MVAKKSKRRVTKKAAPEPVKPEHAASLIESNALPEWDVAGLFSDEETRKILDDPSWEKIKGQLLDESSLKDFSLVDENTPSAPPLKLGAEGERKGTAQDVAQWMSGEVTKEGILYQGAAAQHILREFGGGFLYQNANWNHAIDPAVLLEFRRLTADSVVWVRPKRFWRLRQPEDPSDKREVENE